MTPANPDAPVKKPRIGLSPKQKACIRRGTHRINVWDGAIRSGKTLSSIIAWLDFLRYGPPGPLAMIGKTLQTLERNVLDVIDELHPAAITHTRGASTAYIMGRLVHLFGANNAAAEGKIRGLTLAGAYLDEATLVSKEFFQQLLGRMSVTGARLFCTTNPDSNRHWLKTEYLDREGEPDLSLIRHHFTLDDNPSLSPEYLSFIKAGLTGLWYKRFILGLWVGADGAVYQEWDEGAMTAPLSALLAPDGSQGYVTVERVLMAGLDYGQTHATRAYLLGLAKVWADVETGKVDWSAQGQEPGPGKRQRYTLLILDEFAPENATVGKHADMFLDWLKGQPLPHWRAPEWLAVDPAAKVFRTELNARGYTTLAAANTVLPGIQTVASLLASGGLYIVADTNTHLLDRLPQYLWDEKAQERGKTEPLKMDDDEVDALRYTVMSSRREWTDVVPLAMPNLAEAA